jgi:polygalacturonase
MSVPWWWALGLFASVALSPCGTLGRSFNVVNYGAKGDGKTLDTSAIQKTIAAACAQSGGSVILFPKDHVFLSFPVDLSKCRNIEVRLEKGATLLASDDVQNWPTSNDHFVDFVHGDGVEGITVSGPGWINGNGKKWYALVSQNSSLIEKFGRPMLLTFGNARDVLVKSLNLQDSPFYNIQMDTVGGIVSDTTILAPPDSPNTDGVVALGSNIFISGGRFAVGGGDNVRILANNTLVEKLQLGTGHGTCVGSVRDSWIQNITFRDIDFIGTKLGARVKTWPGAKGVVRNIEWSNIRFHMVREELINIDMFYRSANKTEPTSLQITDVRFKQMTSKGKQSKQVAGVFRCQPSSPCSASLDQIEFDAEVKPWACENAKISADQVVPPLSASCK